MNKLPKLEVAFTSSITLKQDDAGRIELEALFDPELPENTLYTDAPLVFRLIRGALEEYILPQLKGGVMIDENGNVIKNELEVGLVVDRPTLN